MADSGHRMLFLPTLVLKQKGSKTHFVFCFHRLSLPLQSESRCLGVWLCDALFRTRLGSLAPYSPAWSFCVLWRGPSCSAPCDF